MLVYLKIQSFKNVEHLEHYNFRSDVILFHLHGGSSFLIVDYELWSAVWQSRFYVRFCVLYVPVHVLSIL